MNKFDNLYKQIQPSPSVKAFSPESLKDSLNQVCQSYLESQPKEYGTFLDIIQALEACKQEYKKKARDLDLM
jgi:hypothetical protein